MRKLIISFVILVNACCNLIGQEFIPFSYQLSSDITLGQFIDELKENEEETGDVLEGLDEACRAKADGADGLSYEQIRVLIPSIISKVAPALLEDGEDIEYEDMVKRAKRIQGIDDKIGDDDATRAVAKKPSISVVITLLSLLGKDIDGYCQKLEDKVDEILDSITQSYQNISHQIAQLDERLQQFPINSFPFTIDKPGAYVLNTIDSAYTNRAIHKVLDGTAITIKVDNVTVDLKGLTLAGNLSVGIKISQAKNIILKNGIIQGFDQGIVAQGASNIKLVDVHVCDAVSGFWFIDCSAITCRLCSATKCSYSGFCFQGLCPQRGFIQHQPHSSYADEDLRMGNRFICPKSLNRYNSCVECSVTDCTSDASIFGFRSIYGFNNLFNKCSVQGLHTTDIFNASIAAAFWLGSAFCQGPINYGVIPLAICEDEASEIVQCEVYDVTALKQSQAYDAGLGRPVGIMLDSHFDSNAFVVLNQENHGTQVNTLSWSASGHYLATGANLDDTIKIWRVNEHTGRLSLVDKKSHGSELHSCAWSPDQSFLASGALIDNGQLKIWKMNEPTGVLTEITGADHGHIVQALTWSPDGLGLYSGSDENQAQVRLWRFDKSLGTLTNIGAYEHGGKVFSIACSPDGCFLTTGAHDDHHDTLRVWAVACDTGLLDLVETYTMPGVLNTLAWSPDGCFLAIGVNDLEGFIKIWKVDQATGALHQISAVRAPQVYALSWSPDGNFLASGMTGHSEQITIWEFDRASGNLKQLIQDEHGNSVRGIAWSPTGAFLASGALAENLDDNCNTKICGQVHVRSSGIVYPKKSIIQENKISRIAGGNGGFGVVGGYNNLIIKNVVYNTRFGFAGVIPVYKNNVSGTPEFFDNVQLPPYRLPYAAYCQTN